MPQPLSRVHPGANFAIQNAGDRPLLRHPALAAGALEAIASWSNVEAFLLQLFIRLLGGNESLAACIYLALDTQYAKTKAIKAAADNVMRGQDRERSILDAILSIAKTNEKDRNKLAHWTWGDSPDLPNALLLVNPRAMLHRPDPSEIYVYRQEDFRMLVHANDRLCSFGQRMKFILDSPVANRDASSIDKLAAEPEIAERLSRQAARSTEQ